MESTETLGSEQMGTDRDPGDQKHPTTSQQPRDSKMQLAKVLLPDGVQKEFEVNKNSEGEALFRQVTRDLSIEEREYFSLCFYDKDEGTRHWLYNDKNIAKQIKGLPWEFSFEVKFYPTTPTTIVDDHARYYVFLQLRRDLLTGRLPATADTHSLLGSFVAQIEFGDAPAEMTDAYEQFIVASKLVPSAQANPETYKKIVDLHREMRGQTPSEAENQFLDHCKHLALYGIHLFKAISDKDKKPVDVGIGAAGINIYQDEQKTHSFSWQNIIKIGYRRTYFSIKLKAGTVEKNEKTLYFKLPNHVAAKRTWKCAVEHHTFFRLIQPEDKTHKSFFNFGSQRFRYQGRTQFQTKIASQMFDKPSTVDRAPSAMSQPIATAENQKLQTLNLTDSELEQRQFERYRRALTPKSYTSSRQDDDAVSTATFAKYSRPSTLLVVSTSGHHQQSPHELSYSPRGDDSSNYSSAAYYMSERSSLRTPSSAYYPPSEYTSPTSPVYFEGQHHGEYHVQMRQTASTSATGPSNSGARRNLFGRASDARSSQASRDSVRLVSFHEPVDPNEPIPNTYPYSELPQIPIERIVHVYHEGHYDRLSPRRQQRPELPYGFGNYTPRNGVSHVDNLQPDGEMDQQPIRFYVDVRHSGASRRNLAKRLSHPGKEDIKEQIDPKDYYFSASLASDPIHRTELSREVQPANIQQYTRRYHHGDSIHKPDTPQYRLITHVHPLAVTNRDGRDGQSSSNLNATISQREQVVSTKVRRESPDADRRVRLSASVDRSGNLTDTTEEMTRSTNEAATPTTVVTTRIVEKKGKGKKNNQKIPPSSNKTDHASFEGQEKRSRFGGFFTKKTSQTLSGYPESTSQFTGELDATHRDDDLEPSTFSHSNKSQQYSSKQDKTIITSVESKSDSGNKKRLMAVESPEVPKKYRLIARIRHEGDEDVVEKPEKYSFVTDSHSGMLEETYRQKELDQIPISSHAAVYHHGKSWSIQRQSTLSQDRSKISSLGADDANLSKKKEVRLIARIESKTEEVAHKKHKKEGSSVFGFFNRPTKLPAGTEYPEKSNVFTGDLDTTGRTSDLEQHPFQHGTHPAYSPKNVEAYQPSENSNGESKTDIPAAYGFPSTSYDGPLETTSLERDLQHVTIAAHSNVYHHGDSSRIEKHASPVATLEKKQKKVKSPKKEKVDVPAEPEKKEIRLIARVRTEPEAEIVDVPVVKETKEKKGDSKSKLPTFGFFSKTTKTTKTTGYPETSEAYTGELDTTDRIHDLEGTSFEHGEHPAYSPKQTVIETIETPAEPEKKRYRLIARFRHEGDEDVVEKPDPYQIATTLYDGPLDEISRETDLDHTPIADHANVYHHGDSSRIEKHASPVATLEKKQKKVKSPKKEKVDVPAEPEKKEIRLIARVRTEPEAEIVDVPVVKETKEKKGDSKSKLPTFGFFSKTTKTTKTTGYPETSEAYTGELDTTDRIHDLEGTSFEHGEHPAFEASSTSITIEAFDPSHEKVIKKPSRFHWFSRWRHEGDEDVVEKPEGYILSSEIYEGPYDNMRPIGELELTPILDHSQVYHNGESGKLEKRSSKEKRIKTPSPERVEPSEIKLVARIQPLEHVEDSEISEKLSPVKDRSRAPSFSMFHRQSKQRGYPEISPLYEGNLDVTGRAAEVENTPIEVRSVPEYHPKQEVSAQHPESSQPNRFYRLIARWRHEGDEDEIEKPDAYKFVTEVYEGPLDDIRPVVELAQDPISDHSQVYHNGESWKAEKNIKPPKPVRNTKKGLSPEPIESEVHEIRLLTRVASSSEEPEEVDVIPAESTPVKPFRLRFLSIGKKSPTSPDSEFPECSPQYDGPVDLTSRSDELEVMPYLHGSVPPYSPKFTPVKKVDKADEERKKYTVIYRFRHEGEEDFADKPEAYGFSSDVYTGSLNEISRSSELEHAAIHDHSQVYHDGLSYKIDNKQKKSKDRTELEEPKTSRLVARVLPQQEASDSGSPKKDDKDKGFRFRFFSKASPKSSGYPEVSPTFEGPIDVTGRVESLEHVPLQSREFPTYSPRKSQEKPSEKSSERTVEPKRYHLIARIRHEGDEETVENPDTYGFASTSYDGPLEETSKSVDVEETPISVYSNVYHHGESIRVEKRQRKAKISAEPEKDDDQENVPPKSRFSFLRGGQKRVLSYPSTLYSGPLETTDRDLDLENIPLSIPVHGSSDQHARKYRLIARIRHAGDEDEVAAHKLHPVFYSFPAVQYSGILEKTALCKEVDEVPIGRFARVYHSGSSGGLIWNLLKNRNSRASKDMDEPKRKRKDQKDQKDIKLIARVLPMKKTPEKSDRFEKATKEEPLREAELVRSTQSEAQGNISTVSYIPSSLTYDVPRPARIEGYTYGGDCYVEIRHERRAEVHLEPVYVLQETNARSHAYLSTATAVFSGASTSAAAADSGANSSTNTTSHSLVLPSFAASVSEDETGIHHFSWTPLHMSPQPEKMSFLARLGFKRDKSNKKDKKKRKKGENETSGETSDSEHDEKREFAIVEFEPESGQPYTTVSTWQETSDLPEQVEVYTDENGRQITRTVKSSQVKHTVQTQSFQNYIVDGDQVPVGVVDVERSREQLTPLGQKASSSTSSDVQNGGGENGGIVETQTRTMTYEAQGGENSAPPGWAEEGLGEYVSSKSVTQGNRTIETITYKTEKDGIVETHVEHRVTIHSDGDIDHDAELSQAILEATQMNPDMVVEKIEVRQETTQ